MFWRYLRRGTYRIYVRVGVSFSDARENNVSREYINYGRIDRRIERFLRTTERSARDDLYLVERFTRRLFFVGEKRLPVATIELRRCSNNFHATQDENTEAEGEASLPRSRD